ncbi:MAG: methyltransferase domain-containing protein [Desulfobulbaceae bacterium]|nr:methyltransferase domain-containing protein [Desulfobulbaceae bacterium]
MSVEFSPCHGSTSCESGPSSHLPLFFLPGWGFDGRILELAPKPVAAIAPVGFSEPADLVSGLADFLDTNGIEKIRLAGWSMGANLALDFAGAHLQRVDSLFLFAIRKQWPPEEIAAIRNDLDRDPAAFMQSFYRKCFLGDRAGYARFVDVLQGAYLDEMDPALLHRGLDYLQSVTPSAGVGVNDLHVIHGGRDIIAPVTEMMEIPEATIEIHEKAGHALFLSPEFVWPECGLAARKETIRQRFSRAASTYESHADVQKEVARELAARLPAVPPVKVLEIGCGSGNYTALLTERFPDAGIVALDFAPGMVEAARQRFSDVSRVELLCRDGEEFIASAGQDYDLITSNATLQWFDDPITALVGMAGAVREGGMLLCSLFGPETLAELGLGISAICGQQVHLPSHRFPSLADIDAALSGVMPEVSCTEQLVQRRYGSLRELLQHIRKTGTSGWRSGCRPLLTKDRLRELEQWFLSEYGGYQISYQTFIVQGRRKEGGGNG